MPTDAAREAPADVLARVYRAEQAKIRATLIRAFRGDFEAADDALSTACARALENWTHAGVPANPAAWLVTSAKNHAIDVARRRARFRDREDAVRDLDAIGRREAPPLEAPRLARGRFHDDDRLRLFFTCCHPALAVDAQVALTLQSLGGLTTEEIARAFLVEPTTMAQRIVRAKRKIKDAGIPFRVPDDEVLVERENAVLHALTLIFNEGYVASSGDALVRHALCDEAIALARLMRALMPVSPEVKGALALFLLHHARRHARTDERGALLVLDEQDRARFDRALIDEGTRVLADAMAQRRAGPFQIQAAIASAHTRAPTHGETDWRTIVMLYDALWSLSPSPVVALNRAVAVAFAHGIDRALPLLDEIEREGSLASFHLLHAARGELLRRRGDMAGARASYDRALATVTSEVERAYLLRRRRETERAAD